MAKYRVSMATWGTSVLTIEASSEEEALHVGETIFRQAFSEQTTFPQFLLNGNEVEHSIDTEFEVEAEALDTDEDPRVEAMAKAYMQEIYGTDDMGTEDAERAREVARIMLREIESSEAIESSRG